MGYNFVRTILSNKNSKTSFKGNGITVITDALVQGGENTGDEVNVHVQVDGKEEIIQGDYCLVSIGRKPNTGKLVWKISE